MTEQTNANADANAVDFVKDIEEFHTKYQLRYEGKPRLLPHEMMHFRLGFLLEEFQEYKSASLSPKFTDDDVAQLLEAQLDALVDLVYVAIGTAHLHGFDFAEAWRRVHAANMTKVRAESASDSKRGTTFDVVKPTGWQPPSHKDLVEDHAHKVGF
jgi:predicted HAD superfamily Cof-like phosphohydrolase